MMHSRWMVRCGLLLGALVGVGCQGEALEPAPPESGAEPPERFTAIPEAEREEESAYFSVRISKNACNKGNCVILAKKLNRELTRCPEDKSLRSECFVDQLDTTSLNMNKTVRDAFRSHLWEGTAVVKGELRIREDPSRRIFVLKATNAWVARGDDVPDARFYKGLRLQCSFAHCQHRISLLNQRDIIDIEGETQILDPALLVDLVDTNILDREIPRAGHVGLKNPDDPGAGLYFSVNRFYTSARLLGCRPDEVALEFARSLIPQGVDIQWFDEASGSYFYFESPSMIPPYYVHVRHRGKEKVEYQIGSNDSVKYLDVERENCAFEEKDPPNPPIS